MSVSARCKQNSRETIETGTAAALHLGKEELERSLHYHYTTEYKYYCLLVWRDRVRRFATATVVMHLSPATRRIRYALLVN